MPYLMRRVRTMISTMTMMMTLFQTALHPKIQAQHQDSLIQEVKEEGRMAIIDTNDIIGRTFLTVPQEDGTKMRLRIIEALDQDEQERMSHPANIKFRAVNGDDSYEEIVSYNQIMTEFMFLSRSHQQNCRMSK